MKSAEPSSSVIIFDDNLKVKENNKAKWDGLSPTWEFVILSVGVFFFYSLYGLCTETFFR